jgi:hypothetical protein
MLMLEVRGLLPHLAQRQKRRLGAYNMESHTDTPRHPPASITRIPTTDTKSTSNFKWTAQVLPDPLNTLATTAFQHVIRPTLQSLAPVRSIRHQLRNGPFGPRSPENAPGPRGLHQRDFSAQRTQERERMFENRRPKRNIRGNRLPCNNSATERSHQRHKQNPRRRAYGTYRNNPACHERCPKDHLLVCRECGFPSVS